MIRDYVAFDLGAESGRALLGRFDGRSLLVEELHRFSNEPVKYAGHLYWDIPRLWLEIKRALVAVRNFTADGICGIGVDTWGLDYALLGEGGTLLGNPYHYRDRRTAGVMDAVSSAIPRDEIYAVTGIQFMEINTLFQLYAQLLQTPSILESAEHFVTIPDLLNFWLTGTAACEYTNATTTQLVDVRTRQWATHLADRLGIPSGIFGPLIQPGSVIGPLSDEVRHETGLEAVDVIAPACHDTGSAVAAVQLSENSLYISSGTWSLLGAELDAPVTSDEAMRLNFTNEGGVCGTYRFLKNIAGLWLLQNCRRCWRAAGNDYTYDALATMAESAPPLESLVDPDNELFLRSENMVRAIEDFCRTTEQKIPENPAACTRAVLDSLALKYRFVTDQLEAATGRSFDEIRIVGGGAKNRLLNQFTANATGRRVVAGPVEATALGNLCIQLLAKGDVRTLEDARAVVARSSEVHVYEPMADALWSRAYARFQDYCRPYAWHA